MSESQLIVKDSTKPNGYLGTNVDAPRSNEMEKTKPDIFWSSYLLTGTFLLVNIALGSGLLIYPVIYDRLGGIGFSTLVQIILLPIQASTLIVLIVCADLTGVSTYHEVLEQMCGHKVRQMAALSILIECFVMSITYLIIIGDQFDRIFATFFGNRFCHKWYLNRIFTIVSTTTLTIWPMTYFKRLDFLNHSNILGE